MTPRHTAIVEGCQNLENQYSSWLCTGDQKTDFTWHHCETCNSNYAGSRYDATLLSKENEIVHFEICLDCVYYIADGSLPFEG